MTTARLQLRAVALVILARILLHRRGTTDALRRMHRIRRPSRAIDAATAVQAVRRAGRLAGARCLAQSVALTAMLDREAHDIVMVLGCRLYADRRWGSHAWVLYGDEVLEPVVADDHTPLARYSAAHDWVPVAPEIS